MLREWLPDSYKVVARGHILGVDGKASPQIDVLVLSPAYPARLLSKKLYLVHGVAAALEFKTSVTARHVPEAAETAATVSALAGARTGNPYREICTPPIYGLLAHSHTWKGDASTPRQNIDKALDEVHGAAAHPT